MDSVDKHIQNICRDAGLGSMHEILGVLIYDRGNVSDTMFWSLTVDDVVDLYGDFISPAIGELEDELLLREGKEL